MWDVVVQPSRFGIVIVLIVSAMVASWLAPQQVQTALAAEGGCGTLSCKPSQAGSAHSAQVLERPRGL